MFHKTLNSLFFIGIKKGRFLWCPFFVLFIGMPSGCVNLDVPHREYNLAKTAYISAVESEAGRYAPNLYHKAERYYQRGEQLFEERDFKKAVIYFKKARSYAERSENVARLKQFQSGGMGQ